MQRAMIAALLIVVSGCTLIDQERMRGDENTFLVTATTSCFGLCPPERAELHEAMHRQCRWPSVSVIHARGTESNGLLGVPHDVWRYSCLDLGDGAGLMTRGG